MWIRPAGCRATTLIRAGRLGASGCVFLPLDPRTIDLLADILLSPRITGLPSPAPLRLFRESAKAASIHRYTANTNVFGFPYLRFVRFGGSESALNFQTTARCRVLLHPNDVDDSARPDVKSWNILNPLFNKYLPHPASWKLRTRRERRYECRQDAYHATSYILQMQIWYSVCRTRSAGTERNMLDVGGTKFHVAAVRNSPG